MVVLRRMVCCWKIARADYFPRTDLNLENLLSPPPPEGSEESQREIADLIAIQAHRTDEDCKTARKYIDTTAAQFREHLPLPPGASMPRELSRMLQRIHLLEATIINDAKHRFSRRRPYEVTKDVVPCVRKPWDRSYPSGHAAWAYMTAAVLSDLFPERTPQLMSRAAEIAESRIVGGVHFPSDVASGKRAGLAIAERIVSSKMYASDKRTISTAIEKQMNR